MSSAQEAALLALVDENLRHPNASIQEAAAAALHALARSYLAGASLSLYAALAVCVLLEHSHCVLDLPYL